MVPAPPAEAVTGSATVTYVPPVKTSELAPSLTAACPRDGSASSTELATASEIVDRVPVAPLKAHLTDRVLGWLAGSVPEPR